MWVGSYPRSPPCTTHRSLRTVIIHIMHVVHKIYAIHVIYVIIEHGSMTSNIVVCVC